MNDEDDHLECAICMQTFTQPKFLPCHHTFCLSCLEGLIQNSRRPYGVTPLSVECPTCRTRSQMPFEGPSKLQTNFYLTGRLNSKKCQGDKCDLCQKEGAVGFCQNCQQFLCDSCKITHGSVNTCKNHIVIPLDGDHPISPEQLGRFCEKHTELLLDLYCIECSKAICSKCKLTAHGSHQAEDLSDTAARCDTELTEIQEKLDDSRQSIQKELETYEEIISTRENVCEDTLTKIDQQAKMLITKVQIISQNLKKSIKENLSKEIAQLEAYEKQLSELFPDTVAPTACPDSLIPNTNDQMDGLPEVTESSDKLNRLGKPDMTFRKMELKTQQFGSDNMFGRTSYSFMGSFELRFAVSDMALGKEIKSRICMVERYKFVISLKRYKDRHSKPPIEQLEVMCTLLSSKAPADVMVVAKLKDQGPNDDISRERIFNFNNIKNKKGWSHFRTWDEVTDPMKTFVKFNRMIFRISFAF